MSRTFEEPMSDAETGEQSHASLQYTSIYYTYMMPTTTIRLRARSFGYQSFAGRFGGTEYISWRVRLRILEQTDSMSHRGFPYSRRLASKYVSYLNYI